eukprot:6198220-Pleurochrysis_carterae.AAC.2
MHCLPVICPRRMQTAHIYFSSKLKRDMVHECQYSSASVILAICLGIGQLHAVQSSRRAKHYARPAASSRSHSGAAPRARVRVARADP